MTSNHHLITITLLVFFTHTCYGQTISEPKHDNESFENLPEGVIKKELAYFNFSGGNWDYRDSLVKTHLIEIPISTFTSSSVIFSNGKISVKITAEPFDTSGHKLTYDFGVLMVEYQKKKFHQSFTKCELLTYDFNTYRKGKKLKPTHAIT